MININNEPVKYVIYDSKVVNKFTVDNNVVYGPPEPIDGLLDITNTISPSGISPRPWASISAWRFVPPPETSTAMRVLIPV